MISANEAYKLVMQHIDNNGLLAEPFEIRNGSNEFIILCKIKSRDEFDENHQYVINKKDGSLRPMHILKVLVTYPDFKSWPIVDVNILSKRVS